MRCQVPGVPGTLPVCNSGRLLRLFPGPDLRVPQKGLDGSGSCRHGPGLQSLGFGWSAQASIEQGGLGLGPCLSLQAIAEPYSLGLGAMAEVGTIVDKVKEVLFQHCGSQQS